MAGTTHDLSVTFGYSPAGQIVSRTGSNDAYAVSTLANQNVTDSHNGLNQVTASASTAVTHDARGNTSGIGSTAYTYDSENKMTGAGGTALHYDPLGRLASIAGGRAGSDYVGDRLMVERNSGGLPDRHFVQAPGEEAPAVWYEGYAGSTNRRFLHKDERGSVIAVSDNAGNVTAVNRYDDYGAPQGTVAGRFGYTGQQWLPEIGLSYYKARMYNPDTSRGGGRFMQPDPIGYRDGMNLYTYVSADPVNWADPTGTLGEDCPGTLTNECAHEARELYLGRNPTASEKEVAAAVRYILGSSSLDRARSQIHSARQELASARVQLACWGPLIGPCITAIREGLRRIAIAAGANAARASVTVTVSFGRVANQVAHTFRHTDRAGLSRDAVQSAIANHLKGAHSSIAAGQPYNFPINVQGRSIIYTAFRLPDGTINIGRIVVP